MQFLRDELSNDARESRIIMWFFLGSSSPYEQELDREDNMPQVSRVGWIQVGWGG